MIPPTIKIDIHVRNMMVCILDDTLELPSLMLDVMLLSLLIGIEPGDMKYVLC